MRKAKTAPKLPTRPDWFAALAAAGDVAYPKTDPVSGRPLSRPNTVTYAEVFERVMLGSAEYPGLLSPSFLGSGTLTDPDAEPVLLGPPDLASQVEAARGGMYMGQGRSAITTYGTGVVAPGPPRNTTDPAPVPQDTAPSQPPFNPPTDRGFELTIDPYAGDRFTARTPQIPRFTPPTQILPGDMPMLNRVQILADTLMRNVFTETYTKVPLGFAETDMAGTPNPEIAKLDIELAALGRRITPLPDDSPEKDILVGQYDVLLAKKANLPQQVFRFSPGRGPQTPAQRSYSDFVRQVQQSPEEYDPRRVFNVGTMLQRGRQDTSETLFDDDIGPIVRSFFERGELGALKQRLINVDFITDDNKIRDMNAPDNETVTALSNLVAIAQRSGVTWEQELERLENDQDYLGRVADNRRGRGSGAVTTYRLPSDDDLTAVFKAVSRSTIGRELPTESYRSMIDAYKPLLLKYQQQQLGGGVVTEPPAAETFAETQIGGQYRDEEFTYGLGKQLNNFMQILGGAM